MDSFDLILIPLINIFRVPTGLYFTIFTLMVIWWMELYHRSANLQRGFLGESRTAFFAVNAVVYVFLLIVIIVFAVKSAEVRTLSLLFISPPPLFIPNRAR